MESDLPDLLQRHAAIWRGTGEASLECVNSYSPLKDRGGIPRADGSHAADGQTITPNLLEPSRFYPDPS